MTKRGLFNSRLLFILCTTTLMLTACVSSQPTRFFVLNELDHPQKEPHPSCRERMTFSLGINPVNLPRYLDRPQIMTRVNENEYKLSELNVWAEPLKDMLTRLIAENLNTVECADIATLPKASSKQLLYRLSIDVIRLDGTFGSQALLEARWSIMEEKSQRVLITRDSTYTEPLKSHDYNALVSAYNRLIDSFSREVIGSLTAITQGTPPQQ